MGATINVNESQSEMIRLVGGKLVKEVTQSNLYIIPAVGEYEWEVTGYALPFELPKAAEYGGGTQTKTRIEFTILSGPSKGMFLDMYTYSIGEKSKLGMLFRSIGVDLTAVDGRWDLDRCIGYRGKSYVAHAKDAAGQVKLGKTGQPYPTVVVSTATGTGKPNTAYHYELDEDGDEHEGNGYDDVPASHGASLAAPEVSWTAFWEEVVKCGFPRDRPAIERVIGPLGADPGEAMQRFRLNEAEMQAAFA